MDESSADPFECVVLVPVYDDAEVLNALLGQLDPVLAEHGIRAKLVVVDDGSTVPVALGPPGPGFRALTSVDVLRLRSNLGHQRAIAIGLTYVHEHVPGDALIIMDGDGEDRPEDVPRLIERFKEIGGDRVVFAERTRRSESLVFTVSYQLYRVAHYVLTGIPVKVGNFSVVPYSALERLVVVADLWNHYAASVFSAGIARATVPTERGERIAGRSSMGAVGLVTHGLSAISVFSAVVGVRLLLASLCLSGVVVALILGLLAASLAAGFGIPGWAACLGALLLTLLAQVMLLSFGLVFFILSGRNRLSFLPIRDYAYFIQSVQRVSPRNE